MDLVLKYGAGELTCKLPDHNFDGVLMPAATGPLPLADTEIRRALSQPIGSKPLRELVRPGEKIAIVTSDISRPCPSHLMLPPLLEELEAAGVTPSDVTIVLALGIHRGHTQAEVDKLVGEKVARRWSVVDSSPDCVGFGHTPAGTPVDVFRAVAEADRRICLGNVEFHYFAGYSGGAKAIMPGVSSHEAIQSNHKMMTHELAHAGRLVGNPVREDIDAVGSFLNIDFILNVVLDPAKNILGAFAGDYLKAHRAACTMLDSIYKVNIPAPGADIVVVSAGGRPKDMNVYQAQKALDNAARAVRPGGVIIWVAECPEGYGEDVFETWLNEAHEPQDLVSRVSQNFELGGHKAAAMALVREKAEIFMVSSLPESAMKNMFVTPMKDVESAIARALELLGPQARIVAMPYGGSILPHQQ